MGSPDAYEYLVISEGSMRGRSSIRAALCVRGRRLWPAAAPSLPELFIENSFRLKDGGLDTAGGVWNALSGVFRNTGAGLLWIGAETARKVMRALNRTRVTFL